MNQTKTRTATIYMDDNNVLHMIMHENVVLDLDDAIDNTVVIKQLTGGMPTLKLIDARGNFRMDKDSRDFVRKLDAKQTIARAVVKSSVISKLMVNFFIKLSKPTIPTKLFTDYESAYEWLLMFKSETN